MPRSLGRIYALIRDSRVDDALVENSGAVRERRWCAALARSPLAPPARSALVFGASTVFVICLTTACVWEWARGSLDTEGWKPEGVRFLGWWL